MVTRSAKKKYKFTYSEDKPQFKIPYTVKISRLIFKILSKFSTQFSSNLASYLFFRPRRQSFNKYDSEIISKATLEKINFNNRKIQTYTWGPSSDKKILFIHGWEGKATSSKHFVLPLVNLGYQIISFDAPAHGKSEGSSTDLPEMIKTIKQISELFGPFDAFIAHSFGTLASLQAFSGSFSNKKLVLIASMANPFTAVKGFQYIFGLNDKVISDLLRKIHNRVGHPLEDLVLSDLSSFSGNEILILHDPKDMVAPISESLFLKKELLNAKFVTISGPGHHKILSDNRTIENIVDFFAK